MRPRSTCSALALLVLFCRPGVSGAGYEFSVSADSTAPYVNTSSPTGTPRNLYLWLACTDEGLAALDAQVTGTLPTYGFTPLNGVMNAGSAGHLLLGVPDCPNGPWKLGYWTVQDSGGTLCLNPAAPNSTLVAVDCEAMPATHEPSVVGFSSDEGPACVAGSGGCSAQSAPFSATYTEIASFEGMLPYGSVWSPQGQYVVFKRQDACYVYDASLEASQPRRVLEQRPRFVGWAPDGRWLIAATLTAAQAREGTKTLWAVPTDGTGGPEVLVDSQDVGRFVWAEDGAVHYWDDETGARHDIAPPDRWSGADRDLSRTRPQIVWATTPGGRDHFVFRAPPSGARQDAIRGEASSETMIVWRDTFPRGDRFLVRILNEGTRSPYDAVLDTTGQIVVDLGNTHAGECVCTTVSSTGQYLVGSIAEETDEDLVSAALYVVAAGGEWRTPIFGAPMGINPHLSRVGDLLAFDSMEGGRVHVGRLVLVRR